MIKGNALCSVPLSQCVMDPVGAKLARNAESVLLTIERGPAAAAEARMTSRLPAARQAASLAGMSFRAACDKTRGSLSGEAEPNSTVCGQYSSITRRALSLPDMTQGLSGLARYARR